MIKDENFITIQGWMVKDLKLKGNELLIFAIIWGFSQGVENQKFTGGRSYLAEWCGITKASVDNALKALLQKGLINRIEFTENNVMFVHYTANRQSQSELQDSCTPEGSQNFMPGVAKNLDGGSQNFMPGVAKNLDGGSQIFIPNNIIYNNNNINKKEEEGRPAAAKSNFDAEIEEFTKSETLRKTLSEFIKFRKANKKPLTDYAFKLILNKLLKLATSDPEREEILKQSMINGWIGVFALKQEGLNGHNKLSGHSPQNGSGARSDPSII